MSASTGALSTEFSAIDRVQNHSVKTQNVHIKRRGCGVCGHIHTDLGMYPYRVSSSVARGVVNYARRIAVIDQVDFMSNPCSSSLD